MVVLGLCVIISTSISTFLSSDDSSEKDETFFTGIAGLEPEDPEEPDLVGITPLSERNLRNTERIASSGGIKKSFSYRPNASATFTGSASGTCLMTS